jgi:tRNA A-37 threonylcarbamoyl transferase component Bud32
MAKVQPMIPDTPASSENLFYRDEGRRGRTSGLPSDIIAQSVSRLRVLALLYAFVFFMAGFFPMLLSSADRAYHFSHPTHWVPGTISITVALLVAWQPWIRRVPLRAVMLVGLAFEVVSSYGIAAAEFLDPAAIDFNTRWLGLSWVAVWTMLFAVVVPNRPYRTLLATLASVSAVPVVVGYVVTHNPIPGVTGPKFFFGLIFPYLLVSIMAYVGARVIHSLGKEVSRARAVGSYRLVELLGAGGMGEVWRAEHQLLSRPAAIKLIRPSSDGASGIAPQQLQERFQREAQATASMRSPHTIELYDFGVATDGTFYYVMELLDGFNLDKLVERFGPVPAERAIKLLLQVCDSLGEAHAEGLIHRDVKPANVFVCRYGRRVDFVKVLDFGMVKSQRDVERAETQLTGAHSVVGSPASMAPEQVLGNRPVDGRSDLYGVGVVAYWLITGQPVFEGKTALELMSQHAQAKPVAPSTRTELEIPQALDELILDCLAKDPAQRPPSADALAERLSSIETPSCWTTSRAREWWDRHQPSS